MQGADGIRGSHEQSLARFKATQHLTSNFVVDVVDESHATFRFNLVAMHLWAEDGPDNYFLGGNVLRGEAVETENGWRISKLKHQDIWKRGTGFQNMVATK